MKKRILFFLLLLGAAPLQQLVADSCNSSCASSCTTDDDCSGCPCSGKTFFVSRPMYQSYRPELWSEFRNDRMTDAQDGMGSAVEAVVFGAKSTKDHDLAKYFLPNCNNKLTVREAAAGSGFAGADLLAQNFNIVTNNGDFASDISFDANQSVVGLGLHYKQGFYFNDDFTSWWYIDTSSSIQRVKNEIHICENITNDGGGANTAANANAVDSMTAAFKQKSWCFGRIDNCHSLSRTGLADVEFKVGKQYMWKKHCHLASYLGVLIPSGNIPKAVNVFEAIVGHGGHWGLSTGGEGGIELWSSCQENWHLNLEIAIHGQYLFNRKQVRSFDLKGKPWSRYQEVYLNQAQAEEAAALSSTQLTQSQYLSTPGINVFTQCVNVKPGFFFNMTESLVLSSDCGLDLEVGYNFFGRQHECIELACCWVPGPALKASIGEGETNPVRNITGNVFLNDIALPFSVDNYNASLITQADLDLTSASYPSVIINMFFGSVGYRWDDISTPVHINAGASYEFAHKNFAVMNRWAAWGKVGIAF